MKEHVAAAQNGGVGLRLDVRGKAELLHNS
jgi:hypothetical protein